jgi:prevent-host-death family protein
MTSVAVSELKASLSEYLSRARAGEEVLLTDRGVPVAKLVPLSPQIDGDAMVAGLVRAGMVRPPERPLLEDFFESEPEVGDPTGTVLKALIEERERGW